MLGMELVVMYKYCRVTMLLHSFGRAFAMLFLSSCLYTQHRHRAEADGQELC